MRAMARWSCFALRRVREKAREAFRFLFWIFFKKSSDFVQKVPPIETSARETKKMSQGDIYRATKIERAYISNLESGKQNPTLETIAKIATAFKVEIGDLTK